MQPSGLDWASGRGSHHSTQLDVFMQTRVEDKYITNREQIEYNHREQIEYNSFFTYDPGHARVRIKKEIYLFKWRSAESYVKNELYSICPL